MDWLITTFRKLPELAVFLTLAVGFVIGQIKFKGFSLGSVTGVLLVGVLVGQWELDISPILKSTFFFLFLFAVGYSVGPQFIRGLKRDGIPQILFAIIVCVACLLTAWACALIAGFDTGNAVGLVAGANTISAVIGVAEDTINQLSISATEKARYINEIPVAYAVTYIFGTAGTAWFISSIGPKILGGNIVEDTLKYEASLGGYIREEDASLQQVYDGTTFRVVEVTSPFFDEGKTVSQLEEKLVDMGWPVYVERIRTVQGDIIKEPALDTPIRQGDRLVLNGPLDTLLEDENIIGHEVADLELLDFRVEALKVIASSPDIVGKTLDELKRSRIRHGVIIREIRRGNVSIPLLKSVTVEAGDVIEVEGRRTDVDRFVNDCGYAERPTNATDIIYVGCGILLGGLLGSLSVTIKSIPLSLSASGGVLIMGIIFGWLRSRRPTFGTIPQAAIWLMNNLGLNMFIAVVGISAGPDFIDGLRTSGINLFIAGIFVSVIPMLVGMLAGKYIFKFHPAITLGACAGARTTTAALGAIQEMLKSDVPALSYTTTYAVGNTLLIIWGIAIVLLMNLV